jgi:putative membrane protein
MMFGNCGFFGGFGWLGLILNLAILVAVIIGLISLISTSVKNNQRNSSDNGTTKGKVQTAREIAQERYARGEIDREQFQLILKDIEWSFLNPIDFLFKDLKSISGKVTIHTNKRKFTMKQIIFSIFILAVLVFASGKTTPVSAQIPTPQNPPSSVGSGMGNYLSSGTHDGYLHDEMIAAYAEKLGIPSEELESRLNNGETLYQIASDKGLTYEQFKTLMVEARTQVFSQYSNNAGNSQSQVYRQSQTGLGMGSGNRNGGGANSGGNRGRGMR